MNVRRASVDEDWEAIHRLVSDCFADMDGRIDPPSSIYRWTPATFAAEAQAGAGYLMETGESVIACGFAKVKGDAFYLGKIAVAPPARAQGLARAIINAASDDAKRLGLAALEIETRIELTENHQTFAALGFVKIAETAHPGYDRPTSITMRKPIVIGHALADGVSVEHGCGQT